jgi:hypothetical protein
VVVSVAVHLAFVGSVALLLLRDRAPRSTWAVAALILILPSSNIPLDTKALVTATLLLMGALVGGRWPRGLPATAGVLLGLAFLVKATAIGAGVALLVVLAGISGLRRSPAILAICSVATLLSAAVLWWIAGQSFTDLGLFVRGTLELAAGYPGAMARLGHLPGAALPALAAGSGIIVGGTTIAVWMTSRRGYRQTAERLALAMVVVYVQYRNSMARPSLDSLMALAGLILVLAIPLLSWPRRRDSRTPVESSATRARFRAALPAMLVLLSAAELVALPHPSIVFLADRARGYAHAVELVVSPGSREEERLIAAKAVRQSCDLDATMSGPAGQAPTDVMPWDTGLVAGYQLKWDPRPVLASYSAYTSWLDDRDAAFFESSTAPVTVIYVNESIDGRYPIADEPGAFQALLKWYQPVVWRGQFLALRRSESPTRAAVGTADVRCGAAGSWVDVPPTIPGQDIYASVDFGLAAPGAVMAALLEPPETHFQLRGDWGRTDEMRFVRGSARDGILVTGYASDAAAIANLWRGVSDKPVTALRISSRAAYAYSSTACVRFTRTQLIPR